MKVGDIAQHLKSMSFSLFMMVLLAYGMATNNPWLQPLYVILIVLGLQFGLQIFKTTRSRGKVEENLLLASRAKRSKKLFEAPGGEVSNAKLKGTGVSEGGMGMKMILMLIAPLSIFIGTNYVLGIVAPGMEGWQSYVIAFLLTVPVSTLLTAKMGVSQRMTVATPKAYFVSEKGVAFDHMGQQYLLIFPLTKRDVQKEKKYIEAETKAMAPLIPNRVRLFTERIEQLDKILAQHTVEQ